MFPSYFKDKVHCLTGPWETLDLPYHFPCHIVRVITWAILTIWQGNEAYFHFPQPLGEEMEELVSISLTVEVGGYENILFHFPPQQLPRAA